MWRKVYGSGYTQRPDVSLQGVLSGLEIALWDIIGKAIEQARSTNCSAARCMRSCAPTPTSILTAARARTIRSSGTPKQSAERAADYVKLGFTGIKFDPAAPYSAFDPRQPSLESMELCRKFCKLIREAVGNKADLLFGTHGQFTASGAIRFAKQ